ncbi:MAG: aminotransferase IV [Bacteroidetes bacterium]|nr:aminotransferase IV [Bacteroidota bacterium]
MLQTFNERNHHLQVWVGDQLWPREEAKVSVFDSSVQGGDAVWEGLRVYSGRRIFRLARHLQRLRSSAHALGFAAIPPEAFIRNAIAETLAANGMDDGAHIRLTLTRGTKITSGMDPRLNQSGCTLIVLAEWKAPVYGTAEGAQTQPGLRLITSSVRRNGPAFLDSHIHHNNLLNNILAKMEANVAGADDALMLDADGFLAETNATNVFVVRGGEVLTPLPDACLPGITRECVLALCKQLNIPAREKRLTLSELYTADEAFCTGTMGELVPVREADGRLIGEGVAHRPVFGQLSAAFRSLVEREAEPISP